MSNRSCSLIRVIKFASFLLWLVCCDNQFKAINNWAKAVLSPDDLSKSLYVALQTFSGNLINDLGGSGSPFALCSSAMLAGWQAYGQKSPVDDRQYYDIIYGWVLDIVGIQAQGLEMIQNANLFMASQAYVNAVGANSSALAASLTPDFCLSAAQAKPGTALYAGKIDGP